MSDRQPRTDPLHDAMVDLIGAAAHDGLAFVDRRERLATAILALLPRWGLVEAPRGPDLSRDTLAEVIWETSDAAENGPWIDATEAARFETLEWADSILARFPSRGPDLAGLRALSDAATPGPWMSVGQTLSAGRHRIGDTQDVCCFGHSGQECTDDEMSDWADADVALIAAAVNYVRAALAGDLQAGATEPGTRGCPPGECRHCDRDREYAATSDVEPRPRASHDVLRPTCGAAVRVVSGDEGTSYYEPLPAPASDVEPSPDLDTAWREAEAALPKDWSIWWLQNDKRLGMGFDACAGWDGAKNPSEAKTASGNGETPAAALRALAAALHTEPSGEPR